MKILHLMPYSPVPPIFGGALRIYHLLKGLARNHKVTVVTYGTDEDEHNIKINFDSRLNSVQVIRVPWRKKYRRLAQLYAFWRNQSFVKMHVHTDQMQQTIDEILRKEDFDIVQAEFPMMAMFRLDTEAIRILDAHNIEYENFRKMWLNSRSLIRGFHYYREYSKLFREELEAWSRQDAIFVTSEPDKKVLDSHIQHIPKFVVPNGVDTQYFAPSTEAPEPASLVFTGMMAYVPNYDGILHFLDMIFPLVQRAVPEAKIFIVGNRPPRDLVKRASANVIVTGYVDDVRPYIRRATVYVVPLRMGSGTRLKILEAMAMKKPVVTTWMGCEGLDVKHGESVLIADDPASFAHSIVELFRNETLRGSLTDSGYELVRAQYDWSVINQRVEQIYESLLHSVYTGNPLECAC